MKNLTVVIRAELEVPDNWELVFSANEIAALAAKGVMGPQTAT